MRFITKVVALLSFLFTVGSLYAHQIGKEEVVFIREYREYGWKEYGANGVRFSNPIQTLVGFYSVEYRLDANHLTIHKLSTSRQPARTVLFTASLSRAQRQAAQKVLHISSPDLIQQQCDSNTVIVDDGFHLDVTFTNPLASKSFSWNGNYVRELVELVDVINEASPEKFRFYKLGQREAFKQSLRHTADAP